MNMLKPSITLNRRQQIASLIVVLALIIGPSYFFYHKYQQANQQLLGSSQQTAAQSQKLTNLIGAHLLLPVGDQPTIATITDTSTLKDQPFFINAKVGDKVLIYSQARETILYRPSTGKVIEIAHLGVNP